MLTDQFFLISTKNHFYMKKTILKIPRPQKHKKTHFLRKILKPFGAAGHTQRKCQHCIELSL